MLRQGLSWTARLTSLIPLLFLTLQYASGLSRYRLRDFLNRDDAPTVPSDDVRTGVRDDEHADDVSELYHTQQLDHFDPLNHATYQQRYFTSDRYLVADADTVVAFLCVGGEGPAMDRSVLIDSVHCTGDMLELARRLSSSYGISVQVFALEHRYYGKSYPKFPNDESPVTTSNLKYLSSRQALEDLSIFIQHMSTQHRQQLQEAAPHAGDKDISWVAFGGSYPGFMAANARLKYPHLVHAAVSSSAPFLLKVDYPEYNQRVGWDLKYAKIGGSDLCYDIVKNGHDEAIDMIKSDPTTLAEMFNVCEPTTALLDRMNQNLLLGDGLITIMAQSNDPACATAERDDDYYDDEGLCNIERLCGYMTTLRTNNSSSSMTDLQILAKVAAIQRGEDKRIRNSSSSTSTSSTCMEVNWQKTLEELSKPTVENEGWRSWLWQTCTEVGYYQTCDENCPYGSFYHLVGMDLEICRSAYGISNVHENVQASLAHYGGLNIQDSASRVLSINGDVDPWSTLGLDDSSTYSMPAKVVPGASHHYWTHVVQETDAIEIVQTREYIYSVVMDWLDVRVNENAVDKKDDEKETTTPEMMITQDFISADTSSLRKKSMY